MKNVLFLCIIYFVFCSIAYAETDLKPAFNVNNIQATKGKSHKEEFVCQKPGKAIKDLFFTSVYTDRQDGVSIVDPKARDKYRKDTKPLSRFERALSDMSDIYVMSNPSFEKAAECTLEWMYRWAREDAYLGRVNRVGEAIRKWGLASIANSYIKIQNARGLDLRKKQFVENWLKKMAYTVMRDYSHSRDLNTRKNNHLYWAAWGTISTAVALDDQILFDWSVEQFKVGADQVQQDGTLPLEMARMSKAFHYHVFGITPLIFIAETAAVNNMNLYDYNNGALHRLVNRVMIELQSDQAYISKQTNRKQNLTGTITAIQFTWMEPYYKRFKDHRMEPWLQKFRPVIHRRSGGNTTYLYGERF